MQESLAFMIDVAQTLADRSVTGNIFLIDAKLDEPALASLGDHRDSELFVRCTGVHRGDGSVLDEVTLNWVIGGVNSKPWLIPGSMSTEPVEGPALTLDEIEQGGFMPPFIASITGQAVDQGVIYPARYGSPDLRTDGWYWSAVVDTHQVGTHHATMHIGVFRAVVNGEQITWEPEIYPCEVHLEVDQVIARNGFTGGLPGYLPLVPASPFDAVEELSDSHEAEAGAESSPPMEEEESHG
jgi:hypothetical protein